MTAPGATRRAAMPGGWSLLTLSASLCACAGSSDPAEGPAYAATVEAFEAGDHAGFGQDDLPWVVLGPPDTPASGGSLDVLSLGVGGEIVLGFGDQEIADGPGADFIIFENAFYIGGDRDLVFAELAEVAVSLDGTRWETYPCQPPQDTDGCAGQTPTEAFDTDGGMPLDPTATGGDAFDLQEVGLTAARYVRIRDRAVSGDGTSAGFDLDAVGLIHYRPALAEGDASATRDASAE